MIINIEGIFQYQNIVIVIFKVCNLKTPKHQQQLMQCLLYYYKQFTDIVIFTITVIFQMTIIVDKNFQYRPSLVSAW